MFKRRKDLHIFKKAKEFLWPEMGWRRYLYYLWHRTTRLSGSSYNIAAGLASGVFASFTPFLGFHFVIAAIVAWIVRGNLIASAIGTIVGNPWTFPFIWYGALKISDFLMGTDYVSEIDFLSLSSIYNRIGDIYPSLMLGGTILGVIFWIISFFFFYYFTRYYRRIKKIYREKHPQKTDV